MENAILATEHSLSPLRLGLPGKENRLITSIRTRFKALTSQKDVWNKIYEGCSG